MATFDWNSGTVLLGNVLFGLFTAGMVHFGVFRRFSEGTYSISILAVAFIWVSNAVAVAGLDLAHLHPYFET